MICHNKALKWIQLHKKVKLHGHRHWNISDSSLSPSSIHTHTHTKTHTLSQWSCYESAIWQHTDTMYTKAFQIIAKKMVKAVLYVSQIHSFHLTQLQWWGLTPSESRFTSDFLLLTILLPFKCLLNSFYRYICVCVF